jgi:uncharacterized integral membrane protein
MLRKLKWAALVVLVLLALILCLQNWEKIQLKFLFSTFELPQTIVLIATLAIGIGMGLLIKALWRLRAWRARSQIAKPPAHSPEVAKNKHENSI